MEKVRSTRVPVHLHLDRDRVAISNFRNRNLGRDLRECVSNGKHRSSKDWHDWVPPTARNALILVSVARRRRIGRLPLDFRTVSACLRMTRISMEGRKRTSYVLMTSAFNEEAYLPRTIESVLAQTRLPLRWIIVSDGSTDSTDDIVRSYGAKYGFIELLRREKHEGRTFCSKVQALRQAYDALRPSSFDFVGNLDADIELVPSYYERIMEEFARFPGLGIASGAYVEEVDGRRVRFSSPDYHTPGSIQVFDRMCYEQVDGYPLMDGGEDAAAGVSARMNGWQTRRLSELEVLHLKPLRTGTLSRTVRNRFRLGRSDYLLGMHPVFAGLKCLRNLPQTPILIGSLSTFAGYLHGSVFIGKRPVSNQFVRFVQREQFSRLRLTRRHGPADPR